MRLFSLLLGCIVSAVALTSCGGGGGSANQGTGTGTAAGSLTLELRDSNGVSTNVVSGSGSTLRATVRDTSGAAVRNALVTFTGDSALVLFSPSSGVALTDATGVATVQVSPATTSASGAGRLEAAATAGTSAVSNGLNYQLSASNVELSALDLGNEPLAAFANRPISVLAKVNGSLATTVPVQVAFQASCGTVSPATAVTDGTGKAASTYSASTVACAGGNVSITASASGASPLQGVLAVLAPSATNMQFVSATPQLMYLRNSVGATQSQLVFKVVDANGTPLPNQLVQVSLITNSQTGVSLGTQGNTAPVSLSSNSSGEVAVAVFAGTVPTSVQVRAALANNTNVEATSNQLTVASGLPAHRAASIGATILAIEGFTIDGVTTEITMSLADRQGNPVPDGTQVNFTAESGVLIPPTCVVGGGTSACKVTLRSQGKHPANGIVAVMAHVPGEEDFVDANANNMYDAGEAFTDVGNAYRDDNDTGAYELGEFSVPRAGAVTCVGGTNGRANTCDGAWGTVDVRAQTNIIFSTSEGTATFTSETEGTQTVAMTVLIQDMNGNSMATDSTILISPVSGGCSPATEVSKIPNGRNPFPLKLPVRSCASGSSFSVSVTSPVSKQVSTFVVTVP